MWPSIRRCCVWVSRKCWPFARDPVRLRSLAHSHARAGLRGVPGPIPWSAESVHVEATVYLPHCAGRKKDDFTLCLPGREPVVAEQLRRADEDSVYRLVFELPPVDATVQGRLRFRERSLGQIQLPYLGRDEYLRSLRLRQPTVFARFGEETLPCRAFVDGQCCQLLVSGVLTSPWGLSALREQGLEVEFVNPQCGSRIAVPVLLSSGQLTRRSALVTVAMPARPRGRGTWSATWRVGDHVLTRHAVRAVGTATLERSLRLCEARYVVQEGHRLRVSSNFLTSAHPEVRVGPCFFVASSRRGLVGRGRLEIRVLAARGRGSSLLQEMTVLLGDTPTSLVAGTIADVAEAKGFELLAGGRSLGVLSLRPVPAAEFTTEGTFQPPPEFTWTQAAEDEITERLSRLLGGSPS